MRVGVHRGASVLPGTETALLACAHEAVARVVHSWNQHLVSRDLAAPLRHWRALAGSDYLVGRCYPFIPPSALESLLQPGRGRTARSTALDPEFDRLADDCAGHAASFARYTDLALGRGWPAMPQPIGRLPAVIFGCGARHRLAPMNLAPHASPTLVLAGTDKDVGRGMMSAHGLPIAPGSTASTAAAAVQLARALGGTVVLKRLRGGNGNGVIVGVRGDARVRNAALGLLTGQRSIIVERCIEGIELRVHFIRGRIWQTFLRRPLDTAGVASGTGAAPRLSFVAFPGRRQRTGLLHPADVRMLESFLSAQGEPSGAFDLIIARDGARIADGGAILEINVPSGAWYLTDASSAIGEEVDGWLGSEPAFAVHGGRVPLWLIASESVALRYRHSIVAAFEHRYPRGKYVRLSYESGWAPILTSSAPALLVRVDGPALERHGVPMNLRPRVWHAGPRAAFSEACPLLAAMLAHCGGKVRFSQCTPPGPKAVSAAFDHLRVDDASDDGEPDRQSAPPQVGA